MQLPWGNRFKRDRGRRRAGLYHIQLDFYQASADAIQLPVQDDRAVGITHDEVKQIAYLDSFIGSLQCYDAVLRRCNMAHDSFQFGATGLGVPDWQRFETGVDNDAIGGGPTADDSPDEEAGCGFHAPTPINDIAEYGAPGLNLGHALDEGRRLVGAAAAAAHDGHFQSGRSAGLSHGPQLLDCGRGRPRALLGIGERQGMALPSHQPQEAQSLALVDGLRQLDDRESRPQSGTVHAGIDIDQDAYPHTVLASRLEARFQLGDIADADQSSGDGLMRQDEL